MQHNVYVDCPKCGELTKVSYVFADSHECSLCGSHGHVELSGTCEKCEKHFELVVYEY